MLEDGLRHTLAQPFTAAANNLWVCLDSQAAIRYVYSQTPPLLCKHKSKKSHPPCCVGALVYNGLGPTFFPSAMRPLSESLDTLASQATGNKVANAEAKAAASLPQILHPR